MVSGGGAWVAVWFEEVGGGVGVHMVFKRNRRGSVIANRV